LKLLTDTDETLRKLRKTPGIEQEGAEREDEFKQEARKPGRNLGNHSLALTLHSL
jgi:hypothetical protein